MSSRGRSVWSDRQQFPPPLASLCASRPVLPSLPVLGLTQCVRALSLAVSLLGCRGERLLLSVFGGPHSFCPGPSALFEAPLLPPPPSAVLDPRKGPLLCPPPEIPAPLHTEVGKERLRWAGRDPRSKPEEGAKKLALE